MNESCIIYECTTDLPVRVSIDDGAIGRTTLHMEDRLGHVRDLNIYKPEELYMHVSDKTLCVIIAKERVESPKIIAWLKKLVRNRTFLSAGMIESS